MESNRIQEGKRIKFQTTKSSTQIVAYPRKCAPFLGRSHPFLIKTFNSFSLYIHMYITMASCPDYSCSHFYFSQLPSLQGHGQLVSFAHNGSALYTIFHRFMFGKGSYSKIRYLFNLFQSWLVLSEKDNRMTKIPSLSKVPFSKIQIKQCSFI